MILGVHRPRDEGLGPLGRESLRNGNVVFRSAGLPRFEPVQIGDRKNPGQFPLTSAAMLWGSARLLEAPITFDRRIYVPGDDGQGLRGSPHLETVAVSRPTPAQETARPTPAGLGVRGDASMVLFVSLELRSFVRTVRTPLTLMGR